MVSAFREYAAREERNTQKFMTLTCQQCHKDSPRPLPYDLTEPDHCSYCGKRFGNHMYSDEARGLPYAHEARLNDPVMHDQKRHIEEQRRHNAGLSRVAATFPMASKFNIGDQVYKPRGAHWSGVVVGTYSTDLTPEGYCVESENEPGSVQIYPAAALAHYKERST